MAGQPVRNKIPFNEIVERFKVTHQQEAKLMIRYTQTVTRELVFAVDLMGFVMKERNLSLQHCPYISSFDSSGQSEFDDQMTMYVRLTIARRVKFGRLLDMEEYLKRDEIGYEEFTGLAHAMAIRAEKMPSPGSRRYKARDFMFFCVMMAELCTTAYQEGMPKAPHLGIMFICRTFSNLIKKSLLIADPWDELKLDTLMVLQEERARMNNLRMHNLRMHLN